MQMNFVQFVGRLGRDLETKSVGTNGAIVGRTTMAVNESYKKGEEWQERTTWINLVFWNRLVKQLQDAKIGKGAELFVEGKLRTDQYEDANGQKQTAVYFEITKFAKLEARERKAEGSKATGDGQVMVEAIQSPPFPSDDESTNDLPF